VSRAGTRTRRGDFYEAEDAADPRARRAEPSAAPDAAAGLEELPDDFDNEEIDEDAAFTDADKARWGDLDEYGGGGAGGSGSDEDEEIEWEDGEGDMLAHLDAPDDAPRGGKRVRRAAAAA
jgi:U3 small nucleolar RNA-associated protein 14